MPVCASVGDWDRSGADPDEGSGLQALARPKSSTFTLPSGVTFTLRRLQVAVHDAALVGLLERLRDLAGDVDRLVDRQRAALQALGEILARDQLEHQERGAVGFLEPVDRRDVGVVERGEQLGLALEARETLRVAGDDGSAAP